jgi:hypothetical protein
MALFARKSSGGNWDNVSKDTLEDLTFPADVLADILDSANEISVWEVDDPPGPELNILAAALHSQEAPNLSDMTFRFISDWRVKQKLGFGMKKTQGDSVDSQLNKAGKHWVIEISAVGDAIQLAKAFKEREPRFFSRDDVMHRFAASVQERRISTERITPGLWKKLIEEGYLQVVAKQQPCG